MLDATRLHEIIKDCLFRPEEIEDEKPKEGIQYYNVEGITLKMGLVKSRVESYRKEIVEMLKDLPDNFKVDIGGGWSFLNMCMTKDGRQWGEHRNCEELYIIGNCLGIVEFCLPREYWPFMPGNMPYILINITKELSNDKSY